MPERDLVSWNAMLAGYARSGRLGSAKRVFARMLERDTVSWNTVIAAFADSGHGQDAMLMFLRMLVDGLVPNQITYTSVLAACCSWDESRSHFSSMVGDHGVGAVRAHYSCVIGVLASTGELGKAWELIEFMPFVPDAAAWGALLSGHRVHHERTGAAAAANRFADLEASDSAPYVLLANL
ncbi:hypothetical protein SELMODRAFT_133320 [Selaginella moellendorffii]|uniref:Pentacotripeptide-repeat region of PRORP domain-containing protein n=2 Tax=Selaginella moellendorffii TaxID=88036 RepID=D8T6S2_SELML|nr:hypothetical protein SELMODRAFT_133320 [Selaginella moellendorffii]